MSFADFRDLFFQVSAWTIVVPAIIAVINFKYFEKPVRWISWYIWFGTLITCVSYILWLVKINNMLLGNIYTIVEYYLICKFFALLFNNQTIVKWLIVSTIMLSLLCIMESITIGITNYNSVTRSIECILIIACSVFWFLNTMDDYNTVYQSVAVFNLIVLGLITYFTSAALLYAFRDFVAGVPKERRLNIWCIHSGLLLVQYIFITYALCKRQVKQKFTLE